MSPITDYFTGLLLMTLSVVWMLLILAWGYKYIKVNQLSSNNIVSLIFFFSIYKVLAYYLFPLVMGVLSNFRYVREDGISIGELGVLYFIEMFSWVTWLIGLALVGHYFNVKNNNSVLKTSIFSAEIFSKILLICLSLSFLPLSIVSRASKYGLELVALPLGVEIFKALIEYGGPPASLLLLVLAIRGWGWRYGLVGMLGLLSYLSILSTRGAIVYSLLFFIFLIYLTSKNKKKSIINSVAIGAPFLLIYMVTGGLPALSIVTDPSPQLSFQFSSDKKGARTAVEEIEWRFGAPSRHSATFIRMYERGDGAGLNPIINSLTGVMPRSINPEKPHPSTVDGSDIYSQGMYKIHREIYGYDTYSMTEFSSGGHAYWELGVIGVLILPFVSGIYIGLCAYFFRKLGIVSLALMMAVFKPFGYVDPKIWVSDIAIQLYQIIMPIIAFCFIYWLLVSSKRLFLTGRMKKMNRLVHREG